MPWTPAYPDINFGLPLIDNIVAVIERDQAEALAWANDDTAMTSFVRIHKCERVSNKFPSLAIIPLSDEIDFVNDGILQDYEFAFEIANTSTEPGALTEDLRKRVAAVRQMILAASAEELTADIAANTRSPLIKTFGKALYEQVRESDEQAGRYYRSVFLTITFRYLQHGG